MSTRFFASIRRNQKQWMVVVTVLSMVSFLFLDDFGRGKGPMSAFGGALVIGCLCAAGMCIIGYPRQKTAEFGAGGFLVGFVMGFIGFGAVGQNKPVVRTASGSFTRTDLEQFSHQRQKVNHFVSAVARKVQDGDGSSGFGGTDDSSLIAYRMYLADARKMGIGVSDEGVNDFLKQLTRGRLTEGDFKECLREARLGEGEMFELVKDELSAQLVFKLTYPPAFVASVPPAFAAQLRREPREPLRYMPQTPLQLWDSFQMLNLKQSLLAVAIPVQDFVGEVSQPSELELRAFFEKYKNNRWVDASQPGFVQMPKVQLAYLTADFEKFEPGVEPSDEEVSEYYEKNKDRYRAPDSKKSTAPKLPDGDVEKFQADPEAADALKPEVLAKPQDADRTTDPAPATEEKKPAESDDKQDAKRKGDVKQDDEAGNPGAVSPKSESRCGDDETAPETPAIEKPAKDNTADPKPAPPAAPTQPRSKAESQPEAVKADEPANMKRDGEAATFLELNDDLKSQIREVIMRDRAFVKIATALDQALEAMIPLGLDYDTTTEATQKKGKAKSIAEKLKQYAQDHNLEYKETPEMTYDELALEPIGASFEGQGRSPVVNEVFMQGVRGEPRMPLFSPRRADMRTRRGAFAYWKIGDSPARTSDLKEDAVREKVVSAWKFDGARSIAEKRANELVEKAKAEGADLAAALSGESVTGNKSDPAVTVIETPEFTWLSTPRSVPSAQQDPMISDIPLIVKAGNEFMKTVFEALGEGEIGVAVNEPRSVFYVVKVKDRETAKDDGGVTNEERQKRFLNEVFTGFFPLFKSPYESLAQYPQRQIDQVWRRNFEQRHNVLWGDAK